MAAIHSFSFRPTDTWKLTAIHRYYDKRYTALHASSFSEGSGVQNEHGLYLGATWNPSWSWLLQGYVDYAHFSWARYLVSSESDAFDALLLTRYSKKQWSVDARYRFHLRQRDNTDKTLLINRYEHRLRLGSSYNLMKPMLASSFCVERISVIELSAELSSSSQCTSRRYTSTQSSNVRHSCICIAISMKFC